MRSRSCLLIGAICQSQGKKHEPTTEDVYLCDPAPTNASTAPPPEGMTLTMYSQSSFGLRSPNTVGDGSSAEPPCSLRWYTERVSSWLRAKNSELERNPAWLIELP